MYWNFNGKIQLWFTVRGKCHFSNFLWNKILVNETDFLLFFDEFCLFFRVFPTRKLPVTCNGWMHINISYFIVAKSNRWQWFCIIQLVPFFSFDTSYKFYSLRTLLTRFSVIIDGFFSSSCRWNNGRNAHLIFSKLHSSYPISSNKRNHLFFFAISYTHFSGTSILQTK